jgi:hypothetical protein
MEAPGRREGIWGDSGLRGVTTGMLIDHLSFLRVRSAVKMPPNLVLRSLWVVYSQLISDPWAHRALLLSV